MGIRQIFQQGKKASSERRGVFDLGNAGVRQIVDTAREGVWLFDAAGRTVFVNRRMADMLGAGSDELAGAPLSDFLDDEDRAAAQHDLPGWLNRPSHYHHLTRRDGRDLWAWVSASPIEDEHHAIVGMLGMFTDTTDRRSMEHALQRAETQFRIVFDSSAIGIVVVNLKGYAVMANATLLTMLGYKREEITGVSYEHVTHPDDVEEDRQLYDALMSGEIESFRREKRYVHCDGHVVWVHVNASLVRGPDGKPQYAISMIEDVTQKYRAERALRASENQLRHALDAARMVIWDWDVTKDRLSWSDNVKLLYDLPADGLPGRMNEVLAIVAEGDRERVSREIRQALQTPNAKFVTAYQISLDSNEPRWYEVRGEVERDVRGTPIRMLGTLVDVTARKRAGAALRESEERFRTLADAAFEGIAITENGKMVDVNDRLLAILGLSRDEVIGRDATLWFANESLPLVERKLRDADPGLYEAVMVRPDGARVHVEVQARSFQASGGRTLRVAAVRDVTARRKAAELLRQAQDRELRAREEFTQHLLRAQEQERQRLASELHDGLGQSLSLVRNRMHLALEVPGIDPEVAEHIRAVAQIASDAVAEVRSLAQNLRPLQIEQLGLTESLRSLVDQVRDSTTTSIDCRIEDVDDVLLGEAATHLYRIFQEAFNNILRHASAGHASIALERDVGLLRLDIRDDGLGFDTMESAGRGLGLTSMRERAQMLGGTLDVRSIPGKGTHLQAHLPFTEPAERT
ncbi:MAG TPA: PAS domain S-box protein [Povalibacter sp.]